MVPGPSRVILVVWLLPPSGSDHTTKITRAGGFTSSRAMPMTAEDSSATVDPAAGGISSIPA
jgi:hypothetical protein